MQDDLIRCLVVDDDAISRANIHKSIEQTGFMMVAKEVDSAVAAANLLRTEQFDVVFLDVEMPDMSGLEFLDTLPVRPLIVMCTANKDYAVDAFDQNVVDFLLKPIKYARFLKAANKVRDFMESRQSELATEDQAMEFVQNQGPKDAALFVKSDMNLHRIRLDDILWVEALADYIIIQVGKDRRIVHMTMKGIESRLPQPQFLRVHRSYIVRVDAIQSIKGDNIIIAEKQIPIGGTYRDTLFKLLNILS